MNIAIVFHERAELFNAKPFKHSYLPDGLAEDVDAEVVHERILQENPVDLQLLELEVAY